MGAISTDETPKEALDRLASSPRYDTEDLNRTVTTQNPYLWRVNSAFPELPGASTQGARYRIALLDCGVKYNILRSLAALGCDTTVFPCTADAKELLQMNPDGIILSPGPGDPSNLGYVVNTVKQLIGKKPIMGVCLGTQILGCVFGSRTYKLKFGHRGSNHPVRDIKTGKVYITSQNHGYAVDADHLKDGMEVAQINLNDGTVEGLRHRDLPIISIQYHPEASPGPTDSAYFFKEFLSLIVSREESCYESASQIT